MAFTYALSSADPDTLLIAQVRLELGDTVESNGVLPSGGNLQDEEIAFYLSTYDGDVSAAVGALAGILSRHWAGAADVQVGPRRESLSQVALRWAAIAGDSTSSGTGGTSFVTTLGRVDGYSANARYS